MKHHPFPKVLSLVLSLLLLITALPISAFALHTGGASDDKFRSSDDETSFDSSGDEWGKSVFSEVTELRTENVKHFDKGDGTYEAISYGGAVHRKDADGKWQDIDNTLTLREDRGAERYVDADARISFAPTASSGAALWQLSENGYSISLSLADADLRAGAVADVKNHATRAEQIAAAKKADDTDALFRVDNTTTILYRNVLANVDLEYILSGNDVKETILVQNVCENYDFPFRLSLSGLIPKATDDGAILLLDAESGKEVYLLPAPYMTDADDSYSDAVSYRLTDLGEGEYEIVVSAFDEWINAPERAFPVAIDPTLTETGNTRDTYFSSTNATEKNTCHGYDSVMWLSSTEKPFIKSVNMPVLPSGATVTNAKLYFAYYYHSGVTGSMTVSAHRATRSWSEDDTWNTLSQNGTYPSLGLSSNALDVVVLSTGSSYPKWAGVNVTGAVQAWYNGTRYANYGNYGIGLNRVSGNYSVILHSREGSGSYTAYFSISYRPINGVYSLLNIDTGMFLKVGNPLMSGQTSYSPSVRDSLFKFAYNAANDTFIIRSMVNNEFVVYHNLSMHKPLSESATANGVTVQDEDFDGSFVWKIGTHPSYPDGSRFAIWNVSGGQNYYLAAEMTAYGCSIKFTTSVSDPGTSWIFIDENDTSMYGVESSKSDVQYMIPGETIDFDYYMYDYRPGVNGPVSYAVYDTNGNPSTLATVNPTTGVCTANDVGRFRLGVTYPNAPCIWRHEITVEQSWEGTFFIKNREREYYAQIDNDDAPNYSNNGGIMEIFPFDGGNYQRWTITHVGNGYYKITSPISGYAITVPTGQENSDDVNLILTTYSGIDNQKWRITTTTGTAVKIKAKSSEPFTKDLVMDLESINWVQELLYGVSELNVRQRKYVENDSYNDEWFLQKIDPSFQVVFCGIANSGHDHVSALRSSSDYLKDAEITDISIYSGSVPATAVNNYLKTCNIFASRSHGFIAYYGDTVGSIGIVLNDESGSDMNVFFSNDCFAVTDGSYYIHPSDDYGNLDLAAFIGCETGKGGANANNLPSVVVAHGATAAIGFKESIDCSYANKWTKLFFDYLCKKSNGVYHTVQEAVNYASNQVATGHGLQSAVVCGNGMFSLSD